MPDRSGDEVVKTLRFMESAKYLPVIMLTADATPEAHSLSESIGVDVFLTKPLNSVFLLEKIAELSKGIEPSLATQTEAFSHLVEDVEAEPDSSTKGWYDESVFGQLVMLGNDTTFIKRLISGFIVDGEKHVSRINESVSTDYLQLRESLHALKGSATELGANKLAELCREGEKTKPYDVGTDKLLQLSKDIEFAYQETIMAFEEAVSSIELEYSV